MPIRFLDTNFHKSPYVRALKGPLKALYNFIICDCTSSGIWPKDLEVASMYIGFEITEEDFQKYFVEEGKAIPVLKGRFFFPDFIEHQHPNGLHSDNIAVKNVITELEQLGLLEKTVIEKPGKPNGKGISKPKKVDVFFAKKESPFKAPLKPLDSSISNSKGNSNSKSNSNGKGNSNNTPPENELKNPPENSENLTEKNEEQNQKFLVPEMWEIFKQKIPKYSGRKDRDFSPLLKIAEFIHEEMKFKGDFQDNVDAIISEWQVITDLIKIDTFYKTKQLSIISNHMQSVWQLKNKNLNENVTATTKSEKRHQQNDFVNERLTSIHKAVVDS